MANKEFSDPLYNYLGRHRDGDNMRKGHVASTKLGLDQEKVKDFSKGFNDAFGVGKDTPGTKSISTEYEEGQASE